MNERRDRDRIVRFLGKGEAVVRLTANKQLALLDGGERGQIAVSRAVLKTLLESGAAKLNADRLSLSSETDSHRDDGLGAVPQEIATTSITEPDGVRAVSINLRESPLAQLYRSRGKAGAFLTDAEFQAGERLRNDYQRACIMPRLGANWEASVAGRGRSQGSAMTELTDAILASRQRVEKAVSGVGPELAGILIDVCCFLKGMETVEAERRWPARSAKLMLKTALGVLSRHYEPTRRVRVATLHWGAADYRPSIGG